MLTCALTYDGVHQRCRKRQAASFCQTVPADQSQEVQTLERCTKNFKTQDQYKLSAKWVLNRDRAHALATCKSHGAGCGRLCGKWKPLPRSFLCSHFFQQFSIKASPPLSLQYTLSLSLSLALSLSLSLSCGIVFSSNLSYSDLVLFHLFLKRFHKNL